MFGRGHLGAREGKLCTLGKCRLEEDKLLTGQYQIDYINYQVLELWTLSLEVRTHHSHHSELEEQFDSDPPTRAHTGRGTGRSDIG